MTFKEKYGSTALVAGASEGLGAAFATHLAAQGLDLVLVARRIDPLEKLAATLREKYNITVHCISCDLSETLAAQQLYDHTHSFNIGILVYNAALSYIGPFEKNTPEHHRQMVQANVATPLALAQLFGIDMLQKKKGALVLMASLAGSQGSGFLAAYAATKAFNRVLAESLWYEWKGRGVDVIGCCAGATSTPNYLGTKPAKTSVLAPRVQTPDEVVEECFRKLGKTPSFITGTGNKVASFLMQRLMPRKMAINIMGDTARRMYATQINK